jgi:hypothetical protein
MRYRRDSNGRPCAQRYRDSSMRDPRFRGIPAPSQRRQRHGEGRRRHRDFNRRERSAACVILSHDAVAQRLRSGKALGRSIRHDGFDGSVHRYCSLGRAGRCGWWPPGGSRGPVERRQSRAVIRSCVCEDLCRAGAGSPARRACCRIRSVALSPRWACRLAGSSGFRIHRGAPGVIDPGQGSRCAHPSQRKPLLTRIQTKLRPGTDDLRHPSARAVGAAAAADDGGLDVSDLAGLRNVRSGAPDTRVPSHRGRQPHGVATAARQGASAAPGEVRSCLTVSQTDHRPVDQADPHRRSRISRDDHDADSRARAGSSQGTTWIRPAGSHSPVARCGPSTLG